MKPLALLSLATSLAPSRGWRNDDLRALRRRTGADFEVVDTGPLPRPGL